MLKMKFLHPAGVTAGVPDAVPDAVPVENQNN